MPMALSDFSPAKQFTEEIAPVACVHRASLCDRAYVICALSTAALAAEIFQGDVAQAVRAGLTCGLDPPCWLDRHLRSIATAFRPLDGRWAAVAVLPRC